MESSFRTFAGAAAALAAVLLGACGTSHPASSSTGPTTTATAAVAPSTAATSTAATSTTSTSGPSTPTSATTATTAATTATDPGCLADQLTVEVGFADAAAGSVGYRNSFENISGATCTLYGYPGLQMRDQFGAIGTDVIRGTSVTVPPVPERLVTLAPGSRAWFQMGFSDGTGYGDAECPASTLVEFTAPNDFQSITIPLQIQPYGGATIARVHCGEIYVSPVYTTT